MYFTRNYGYQNVLVFIRMLSSLILNSNKKVPNWISIGISSEKIKPFETNVQPNMSNKAKNLTTLFYCKETIFNCILTVF